MKSGKDSYKVAQQIIVVYCFLCVYGKFYVVVIKHSLKIRIEEHENNIKFS